MSKRLVVTIFVVIIIVIGAVWISVRPKSVPTDTKTEGGIKNTSGLSSLFPFSNKTAPTLEQQNNATSQTVALPPAEKAPARITSGPLVQVTNRLVAGLTTRESRLVASGVTSRSVKDFGAPVLATSNFPTVRFVERGTGYVYDIDANGKNENKISGTAIIRASQALFADSGNTVLIRYIKNDNSSTATFLGRITTIGGGTAGTLSGDFLPDNLYDVSVSPDGKNITYLLPIDSGTAGITMKTDLTAKKQIFISPFTEWLLDVTKSGTFVTTKSAGDHKGYAYKITPSGNLQKIIGGINGLTTKVSPNGTHALYSIGEGTTLRLHILRLSDNSDTDTGLQTLPEKCVWGKDSITAYCGAPDELPSGKYPDDWYQGVFHFNDSIWKLNIKEGTTIQINSGGDNNLDMTYLNLDPSEKYLIFINKNDGSLWSLDIPLSIQRNESVN
ncbi:MAG: hypothetical protein KBC17_02305 [Candidatus Pacebacteria bacterium]|nr:hypothetical protein [Candidatus Paceibacterota bacterium]